MRHNAYQVAGNLRKVGSDAQAAFRAAQNRVLTLARTDITRDAARELGVPIRALRRRVFSRRSRRTGRTLSAVLSIGTARPFYAEELRPTQLRAGVKFGGRGKRTVVPGSFLAPRFGSNAKLRGGGQRSVTTDRVVFKRRTSARTPLMRIGLNIHPTVERVAVSWVNSVGAPTIARVFSDQFARRVARTLARRGQFDASSGGLAAAIRRSLR